MKRRTITQKVEAEDGDEAAAVATTMTSTRLTSFDAKELIIEHMNTTRELDYYRIHLERHLRLRGWRDLLRYSCHDYIRGRGVDNVNIINMLNDLLPLAKVAVGRTTKEEIKSTLRLYALEIMTVEDSTNPTIKEEKENESLSPDQTFEFQPRDTLPEAQTELTGSRQGPPQYRRRLVVPQLPPASPPVLGAKSPLGALVVLDRIDREREKDNKEKADSLVKEKEKAEKEEKERIEKEREREKAEREREKAEKEKEKVEREKEKAREKERQFEKERQQKERDRHERQERHNLNIIGHSVSLPASPRSPSVRADKKMANPEPNATKLVSQAKQRTVPEPIQATGLASTLLTATAAIAGKKSKHINLNGVDDDEDEEELMDI